VPGHAALVTAGGKGSRISEIGVEKPLVLIAGVPMIDRILGELGRSKRLNKIYVSVSPLAPKTREHLEGMDVVIIDTPGNGYVADLNGSMLTIDEDAVLVCPSDMPLITSEGVDALIDAYDERARPSLTVALPPKVIESLGLIVTYIEEIEGKALTFCGVSVVDRKEMLTGNFLPGGYYVTEKEEFAVNVNTVHDLRLAERFLEERSG
jgi:adenosylcobinamide-phosphate guanylyltransferase